MSSSTPNTSLSPSTDDSSCSRPIATPPTPPSRPGFVLVRSENPSTSFTTEQYNAWARLHFRELMDQKDVGITHALRFSRKRLVRTDAGHSTNKGSQSADKKPRRRKKGFMIDFSVVGAPASLRFDGEDNSPLPPDDTDDSYFPVFIPPPPMPAVPVKIPASSDLPGIETTEILDTIYFNNAASLYSPSFRTKPWNQEGVQARYVVYTLWPNLSADASADTDTETIEHGSSSTQPLAQALESLRTDKSEFDKRTMRFVSIALPALPEKEKVDEFNRPSEKGIGIGKGVEVFKNCYEIAGLDGIVGMGTPMMDAPRYLCCVLVCGPPERGGDEKEEVDVAAEKVVVWVRELKGVGEVEVWDTEIVVVNKED